MRFLASTFVMPQDIKTPASAATCGEAIEVPAERLYPDPIAKVAT
jgi:hypothetical protein